MGHRFLHMSSVCLLALILAWCVAVPAFALSDEERETLEMFFDEQDRVVTVTRTPKPISQVAENVTVITAGQIERMNAHTLAEVLNVVPGVQVMFTGNPANITQTVIQGSEVTHVRIMIDGIPIGDLLQNVADIGPISAQSIERVEIIKGPASALWGSAMGGAINVITKAPAEDRPFGGTLSASLGTRATTDMRGEFSGIHDKFGYYLMGSNFRTNGFHSNDDADVTNVINRLRLGLTDRGQVDVAFRYFEGTRGNGQFADFNEKYRNRFEHIIPSLGFDYHMDEDVTIHGLSYLKSIGLKANWKSVDTDDSLLANDYKQLSYGASLSLDWLKGNNALTVGYDYDSDKYDYNFEGPLAPYFSDILTSRRLRKWGLFATDSISFDRFSVSSSLRYDDISAFKDHFSFNVGATFKATEQTILRFVAAKGYSLPILGTEKDSLEKVWTYQAGIETSDLRYLWLKSTLFRHEGKDERISVTTGKLRRQGFEVEARTIPFFNTALQAGFVFIDAKNLDDDEVVKNTPRYTYDVGIAYDDRKTLNAILLGHYVWWNADALFQAKYTAMIWDFSLTKKVELLPDNSVDIFFSAHNLFNGTQNLIGYAKNPGRWFEGGLRFKF